VGLDIILFKDYILFMLTKLNFIYQLNLTTFLLHVIRVFVNQAQIE